VEDMNLSYDWNEDDWTDDFIYNRVSEVINRRPLSSSDLMDNLVCDFGEVIGLMDVMKKGYYFKVKPNKKKWSWEYIRSRPFYKGNETERVKDNSDGTYEVMVVASAFLNSRMVARKVFRKYLKERKNEDQRSLENS
jgi:hypothetical protein